MDNSIEGEEKDASCVPPEIAEMSVPDTRKELTTRDRTKRTTAARTKGEKGQANQGTTKTPEV